VQGSKPKLGVRVCDFEVRAQGRRLRVADSGCKGSPPTGPLTPLVPQSGCGSRKLSVGCWVLGGLQCGGLMLLQV